MRHDLGSNLMFTINLRYDIRQDLVTRTRFFGIFWDPLGCPWCVVSQVVWRAPSVSVSLAHDGALDAIRRILSALCHPSEGNYAIAFTWTRFTREAHLILLLLFFLFVGPYFIILFCGPANGPEHPQTPLKNPIKNHFNGFPSVNVGLLLCYYLFQVRKWPANEMTCFYERLLGFCSVF